MEVQPRPRVLLEGSSTLGCGCRDIYNKMVLGGRARARRTSRSLLAVATHGVRRRRRIEDRVIRSPVIYEIVRHMHR